MKTILFASFTCLSLFISLSSFSPGSATGMAQEVLIQTNQFRASMGLPELTMRAELNAIAQGHSENMARGIVGLGHDGFENRNTMAKEKIGDFFNFAENVAYGASSGKAVVDMWKNSTGHRLNMLGHYKYIGIGVAKDREGRIYYTQIFAG